ncbi:MAG: HDOD domain-containing protein [Pontiellaceae bacterium]|nr:HDOD domain-containing protein [Pontiellaceae bacterium]MBN2785809.1 HDOD domain-containing protein [Pontiellaceae bacterium]
MNKRDKILNALGNVEYLASPSMAALGVMNDTNVDRDKLLRTLELDPALTSNLLRFANSAYFGFARSIHSVNEAVVRLGLKSIRRMLYLSISSGVSHKAVQGYDLPPKELWHHLATSAVCTEILAKKTGTEASEVAFTAALLHDVGKMVLGSYLAVDAAPILKLAQEQNMSFDEAETEVLGINHAEIGAELLTRWNLPDAIIETVRWHHDPDSYPDEDKNNVDLVHLSDAISIMAGTGLGIDGLRYNICKSSERRMGCSLLVVEQVLCDLRDEAEKLESAAD